MADLPKLPDTEALALDLLNYYLPGEANFRTTAPNDWSKALPLVWVARTSGRTVDYRVDHAILSVSVVASTRKAASDLARRVQSAFYQARRDNYFSEEGVVSNFETIKGPQLDRDGLTGKHPDSFNFDATYDLWARARD
ncbi:hypothetical protein [Actinomadura sp. WMMB 499]|uniref:phage tail termination protein n=1 Tax=Actinomadura sp. WMMB 499 TaxID=1219491 RepID=UPI00124941A2|nr:hypothetical protein [Actinomadura sp. WMMB 499]QFG25448.1 hypothetical protein F7P10_34090 [Actinomadura sp. WMMB 499]